jgi:hypothetical protein
MKIKALLIVSVALLLSVQAKAQLGVQIGQNFAKIDGNTVASYDEEYLKNFTGGVYFDKDLIPLIDLRIGAFYSPKGSSYVSGDYYNNTCLNYIEVPVQAKVKVGPVYALGGAYGAYALNGSFDVKNASSDTSTEMDFDTDQFRKEDFGLKFGIGFQIGLGPLHVFIEGDYSMGMLDIYNGDAVYKNNNIGAFIGANIGF